MTAGSGPSLVGLGRSNARSPVPWFGGKQRLAERIIALLPPHDVYVEVFGGGGSVLLSKAPTKLDVYNDADDGLVNFFRCLRDRADELVPLLELTIHSLNAGPMLDRKEVDVDELERGEHKELGVLSPPDLVFHFHGITDEQAARLGDLVVEHVVAGRSCDSDFREEWKASLARTVEHFVLGVHE